MTQIGEQPYLFKEQQDATKAAISIDLSHSKMHSGNHFMYTDCVTLGSGAVQNYVFTTLSKYSHMSVEFEGSTITSFDIYESTDRSGTTLQTIYNSNRNSLTASVNSIHKGSSGGTTDGTKIFCHSGGTSTNQSKGSVSSSTANEIILKLNTKYILRITSGTADNLTNIKLYWYEL
jgi:hypothetical protein